MNGIEQLHIYSNKLNLNLTFSMQAQWIIITFFTGFPSKIQSCLKILSYFCNTALKQSTINSLQTGYNCLDGINVVALWCTSLYFVIS